MKPIGDQDASDEAMWQISSIRGEFGCGSLEQGAKSCEAGGWEGVRGSGRVKDRVNVKRLLYEQRLIEVARGQVQNGGYADEAIRIDVVRYRAGIRANPDKGRIEIRDS